jgi:hypothetical protein
VIWSLLVRPYIPFALRQPFCSLPVRASLLGAQIPFSL